MPIPLGGFTRPTDNQFIASHINGFSPLTSRNAAWANPINGGSWISNVESTFQSMCLSASIVVRASCLHVFSP